FISETAELLRTLTDQDAAALTQLEAQLADTEAKLTALAAQLERAAQTNRQKQQLAAIESEQQLCAQTLQQLQTALTEQQKLLPQAKQYETEAAQLQAELADYANHEAAAKRVARLSRSAEDAAALETRLGSEAEDAQRLLRALQQEHGELQNAGLEEQKLKAALQQTEAQLQQLKKLADALADLQQKQTQLDTAKQQYIAAADEADRAQQQAAALRRAFNDEQAGIMAAALTDGVPCPVCGSVHHPNKAALSQSAPTEQQVELAEQQADAARKAAAAASDAASAKGATAAAAKDSVLQQAAELGESDLAKLPEMLRARTAALLESRSTQQTMLKAEQANVARKAQLEQLIPQKQAALQTAQERLQQAQQQRTALLATQNEASQQLKQLAEQLRFPCLADAQAAITALQQKAAAITKAEQQAKDAAAKQQTLAAELSAKAAQLTEQLQNAQVSDSEALRAQQAELTEKKTAFAQQQRRCSDRLGANSRALSSITATAEQLAALEEKLAWVKELSDTANGSLTGKERVMLETYVQMHYFDRILARANTHLMRMSGAKYELKRRQTAENLRAQSGLDLDVVDHYNGSERSVKSLSGGESFVASLSLALGLAEEVQASAGGIRLESMFVDEGFGSLDDETLQQAMQALISLADGNRLVGIISHVAALREQIDTQLVVKKRPSGGSTAEIRLP
ncbi:MAG: SMC family ATPase, partial [Oscillospiraceae bacterium]|nr:SMC family ATPase [Oscillospiraceae bacterium]